MEYAEIYAIPVPGGFAWKWLATDNLDGSDQAFAYYFDCLLDATENGYIVKPGAMRSAA